ncbi:hypothetical protein L0Y69_01915 [bacterium]|nr:hypothetical protein [bacterium]
MKVVRVVPILRSVSRETLSYFTSGDIALYSLVKISIRGKSCFGLVAHREDVKDVRSEIRSGTFALRKISRATKNFLLPEFLEAASETAEYFAATTGSVIASLIPAKILEEYGKEKGAFAEPSGSEENKTDETQKNLTYQNAFVIQLDDASRYAAYRALIRETFARGQSVFFSVPKVESGELLFREIEKGIPEYAFLFHGSLAWKALRERWGKAMKEKHPICVVGTPLFLSLPRPDIGLIAVEEEHASAYRGQARPYFDQRYFAESLAKKIRAKFILGSSFVRTETWARYEERELIGSEPLRLRLLSSGKSEIIDAKKDARNNPVTGDFRVITEALAEAMQEHLPTGNVFLYGVRRGLAPMTLCRDCGAIVSCKKCGTPITLHGKSGAREGSNFFLCHKCGERRSAQEKCASCNSWRLQSFGIGVEAAAEEARKLFPEAEIFEMHSDSLSAKSEKEVKEIKAIFSGEKKSSGMILIGTEKALPFVTEAALSGVLSVDPLFLIPDFRMRERILRTLLEIREKTDKLFLVQTRKPEEEIFDSILHGDLLKFYRSEIRERERFAYPPFSVLIKISWSGNELQVKQKSALVKEIFGKWEPRIFPAFIQRIRNRLRVNALMKIPKDKWPDEDLSRALFSLTPDFTIDVSPEDTL